jgi:asparagine synthase (glutamine-hydrolysing)
MCGIVAEYSSVREIRPESIQSGMNQLIHRGPDHQQHWIAPDKHAGLGHTRLSIIDLTGGNQPILNEDGSIGIVVNGEFYGYEPIMEELEEKGHHFRTRSDSEIALHLYEELGTRCLSRLRGEFSFVLWDTNSQTLFAARDRFGIKPLYYAFHDDILYLASEAKAVLAAGVPAGWDDDYVFFYASTGVMHQDRSCFKNIYQVPPGQFLLARNQHRCLHTYWDFSYPPSEELPSKFDEREYIEGFREILDEAVRLRMRADVPVGCYLSGGLDSCAVLGLMSAYTDKPIRTFTLTFDRDDYNEGPIAEEMAKCAAAEYYPILIKQDSLADHLSDALWHSEVMLVNGHGVAKFLLSRAVHQCGYKVVYTGEGADEILAGYPHFRNDLLITSNHESGSLNVNQSVHHLHRKNVVSEGILLPHGGQVSTETIRRHLGYVPTWIQTGASIASCLSGLLDERFSAKYRGRNGHQVFLDGLDVENKLVGRDPVNQSMYLWAKSALPGYILTVLGDRMEMAHSIEGRVPFLDHHVVEFMCRVPMSLKIHDMTEKYILREAVRPKVTETVYRRQKHPFLSPPASLNPESSLHTLLQDTIRGNALQNVPFFAPQKVRALLDEIPKMDTKDKIAVDPALMIVLSTCLMHERFHL